MIRPVDSSSTLSLLNSLGHNRQDADRAAGRLSTGVAIRSGKDGPAALISSERLRAVLATLEAESAAFERQDQVATTADGYLAEASGLLAETRGLQVQAADTTRSDAERAAIQQQIDANLASVDRLATSAGFNGQALFNGQTILSVDGQTLDLPALGTSSLGQATIDGVAYGLADAGSAGALAGNPAAASQVVDAAAGEIASLRGRIGAFQSNTIRTALNTNAVAAENTAAATSAIRDADYAAEAVNLRNAQTRTAANLETLAVTLDTRSRVLDLLG